MEKQHDEETALQRGEARQEKEGGEGWRAGGREGAPLLLMKSLHRTQRHKSYGTVTREGSGGHRAGSVRL